jgi:hypothetical protein
MAAKNIIVEVCNFCGGEKMEEDSNIGFMFCTDCGAQGEKISADIAFRDQWDKNNSQHIVTDASTNKALLGKKSGGNEKKEYRQIEDDYSKCFESIPIEIRQCAYAAYADYKHAGHGNRGEKRLGIIAGFMFVEGDKAGYPFSVQELLKMIKKGIRLEKESHIQNGIKTVISHLKYVERMDKDKFVGKYKNLLGREGIQMPPEHEEMIRQKMNSINFEQDNDLIKCSLSALTAAVIAYVYRHLKSDTTPEIPKKILTKIFSIPPTGISNACSNLESKGILPRE